MNFTPIAPTDLSSTVDNELIEKANRFLRCSAKLEGSHNTHIIQAIKKFMDTIEVKYTNALEVKHFKADIYLEAYEKIQRYFIDHPTLSCYDKNYITNIHTTLKELSITHSTLESSKEKLLVKYEYLYNKHHQDCDAVNLIYILASYHRLILIDPFGDGDARIARFVLNGAFSQLKMDGHNLWSISHALMQNEKLYKQKLTTANMLKKEYSDDKGTLSSKALSRFVDFMLDVASQEVAFMQNSLKIDALSSKLEKFVTNINNNYEDEAPLPKHSQKLLFHLLVYGECKRGKIAEIIGMKDRTASRVTAELLKREFIESKTPSGAVRLKINSLMGEYLFDLR